MIDYCDIELLTSFSIYYRGREILLNCRGKKNEKSEEGKEKIGRRERTKNQVKWTSTLRAMKTLALPRLPSTNKPL